MFKNTFGKNKYHQIPRQKDANSWKAEAEPGTGQPVCGCPVSADEMSAAHGVCPQCGFHGALSARERIELLCDGGSFVEFGQEVGACNILGFPYYEEKLAGAREATGLNEAIITGYARIGGNLAVLGIMEPGFMMASMGAAVGEKVSRAVEQAADQRLPLVIITASGGARMQEGMAALMQMAKTSAAVKRLHDRGGLFVSVLTNPTTGGVLASFATLADIIIAEPGALIGFAGPRVIEQTIRQTLPPGFQRSEFLLEHGMLDMVVPRTGLPAALEKILRLHEGGVRAASRD